MTAKPLASDPLPLRRIYQELPGKKPPTLASMLREVEDHLQDLATLATPEHRDELRRECDRLSLIRRAVEDDETTGRKRAELERILTKEQEICPDCNGGGCPDCGGVGAIDLSGRPARLAGSHE